MYTGILHMLHNTRDTYSGGGGGVGGHRSNTKSSLYWSMAALPNEPSTVVPLLVATLNRGHPL